MRKYAILKEPFSLNDYGDMCVKIMLHETKHGTYAYLYVTTDEYGSCSFDNCFEDLVDAEEYALDCGVRDEDWIMIDAPLKDCLHDQIHPIRRKGRNTEESKLASQYELWNGVDWVDIDLKQNNRSPIRDPKIKGD